MSFHSIELVAETCIGCHAYFGLEKNAKSTLIKSHKGFSCPYCRNQMHYSGKTDQEKKLERLEKDNEENSQEITRQRNRTNYALNSLRSTKGVVTKLKKKLEAAS